MVTVPKSVITAIRLSVSYMSRVVIPPLRWIKFVTVIPCPISIAMLRTPFCNKVVNLVISYLLSWPISRKVHSGRDPLVGERSYIFSSDLLVSDQWVEDFWLDFTFLELLFPYIFISLNDYFMGFLLLSLHLIIII